MILYTIYLKIFALEYWLFFVTMWQIQWEVLDVY